MKIPLNITQNSQIELRKRMKISKNRKWITGKRIKMRRNKKIAKKSQIILKQL
jgi:hypothetical protein